MTFIVGSPVIIYLYRMKNTLIKSTHKHMNANVLDLLRNVSLSIGQKVTKDSLQLIVTATEMTNKGNRRVLLVTQLWLVLDDR